MQVVVTHFLEHVNSSVKHTTHSTFNRQLKRVVNLAIQIVQTSNVRLVISGQVERAVLANSFACSLVNAPADRLTVNTHSIALLLKRLNNLRNKLTDSRCHLPVLLTAGVKLRNARQHNNIAIHALLSFFCNLLNKLTTFTSDPSHHSHLALSLNTNVAFSQHASSFRLNNFNSERDSSGDVKCLAGLFVRSFFVRRNATSGGDDSSEKVVVLCSYAKLTVHRVFSAVHSSSNHLRVQALKSFQCCTRLPAKLSRHRSTKRKLRIHDHLVDNVVKQNQVLVSSLSLQCNASHVVCSQHVVRKQAVRVAVNVVVYSSLAKLHVLAQPFSLCKSRQGVKTLRSLDSLKYALVPERGSHAVVKLVNKSVGVAVVFPDKEQLVHVKVRTHLGHKLVGHNNTVHAIWQEVNYRTQATRIRRL